LSDVLLTLDVDWAPDFAIRTAARKLEEAQVRSTWFVTHASPATRELLARPDLFEVGIHPNFLPGSTHGPDPSAVLRHCLSIAPEARSMRSHGLCASTAILGAVIRETDIRVDGTLFLPRTAGLGPVDYYFSGRSLLRIPHFFEDDFEMERPAPAWELAPLLALGEGLKVFDFHPVHVALNSPDMDPYTELKRRCPRLDRAAPQDIVDLVHRGSGAGTLFDEVVDHLSRRGRPALSFSDLARRHPASGPHPCPAGPARGGVAR
jgi:hypothetical protein